MPDGSHPKSYVAENAMIDGVTILITFALIVAAIVLERPARNAR